MKLTKNTKKQTGKTITNKNVAAKPVPPKRGATKRAAIDSKAKPAKTKTAATPRQEITPEAIAARAYTLWEKDGRPNGRDAEYWFQAESQLKQETQSFAA